MRAIRDVSIVNRYEMQVVKEIDSVSCEENDQLVSEDEQEFENDLSGSGMESDESAMGCVVLKVQANGNVVTAVRNINNNVEVLRYSIHTYVSLDRHISALIQYHTYLMTGTCCCCWFLWFHRRG